MDTQKQIEELKKKINDLENRLLLHDHSGNQDQRIRLDDISALIEVVSTVPSHVPRDFNEQFRIYKNGTTYRFYWHDGTGWRYATGT
jgi:hypothetical protein